MKNSIYKKLLPKSLFGRFLLIIIIPNIIIQVFAIYMFYERHWSGVSKHMVVSLAGDIELVVKESLKKNEVERQKFIDSAKQALYFDIEFRNGSHLLNLEDAPPQEFEPLESELNRRLPLAYSMYYLNGKSSVAVDVEFKDGVLSIISSRKRMANPSTYIFVLWMTGAAFLLVVIAIIFMRNQVRSIIRLADVADQFGKGMDTEQFKPEGASEVRKVSAAFIDMRDRLKRQLDQRTEMLAGVSHDLKTPLTRMKLQLAMVKSSKAIKELEEDVSEMEKMIAGYLDFAKGKERAIDSPVNISDLVRSVVSGYRNSHSKIELNIKSGVTISLNPNAFRRAITNIVDNALKYANNIKIMSTISDNHLFLIIDDDGPGIPHKKRDLVFKPFFRLDTARNMDKGGTGLGLAITKDIIVGYGGDISLDNSPMGGLRVVIKLPL